MVFNTSDFYDLLQQLPPPIVITSDFSSHSTLWGCTKLDRRGKVVEDILIKHNLCILNDTCPTYIHPATGSFSAIDISICSPDIFLDMQWKTLDDLCGSHHYPISVTYGLVAPYKPHLLFLVGNFVKLTGPLSPTMPSNN